MIVDVDLIVFNCVFSRAVTLNRLYIHNIIALILFINCSSGSTPWCFLDANFDPRFDHSFYYCPPLEPGTTEADAHNEWNGMLNYWRMVVFRNPNVEVFRTETKGLGKTLLI